MAGSEPAGSAYLSDHETKFDLFNDEAIVTTVLKLSADCLLVTIAQEPKWEHPVTKN